MVTIIFAHPKHASLNGRILKQMIDVCKSKSEVYTVIDLCQDDFSPVLTEEELDGFYNGVAVDPLVKQYQDTLMKTDKLIVLFPIWWNECPAILKGFFERVCLGNFAFEYVQGGVRPKMKHIKSSLTVTTSHAPTEVLKNVQGNMVERQVIGHMLKGIGIEQNTWLNFGGTKERDIKEDVEFMDNVKQAVLSL